jgi:serine/threonine-protein kinase
MDADGRLTSALADRYTIEAAIDSGGMATVYRARDLKHDRTAAIKVLKPDLAEAIGADRFLREIRTTANLSHPHILPLHDCGEAEGFLFCAMPFVEGKSLRDCLEREGQLPVEDHAQNDPGQGTPLPRLDLRNHSQPS